MLEVKNPWDQKKVLQRISFQNSKDIEKILELAKKNSVKRLRFFNQIRRIDVLENFFQNYFFKY